MISCSYKTGGFAVVWEYRKEENDWALGLGIDMAFESSMN